MDKIIILTPVKNEDWILDIFLSTCSLFADAIIIADQGSTDLSCEIYKKYSKVILIENKSEKFNEDERQIQLIEAARKYFPNDKRILIALDADEVMSANILYSDELHAIRQADLGTSLYFEKPTFIDSIEKVIPYEDGGFPLGYIDDGQPHNPSKIHSNRLPLGKKKLILKDLKVLHYGLIRPNAIAAKLRFYSCLENIKQTKSLFQRRISYPEKLAILSDKKLIEISKQAWLKGYFEKGIDLSDFRKSDFFWHDLEVLHFFSVYGQEKFYNEDIWYFDWNKAIKILADNKIVKDLKPIEFPSLGRMLFLKALTNLFSILKNGKRTFRKFIR